MEKLPYWLAHQMEIEEREYNRYCELKTTSPEAVVFIVNNPYMMTTYDVDIELVGQVYALRPAKLHGDYCHTHVCGQTGMDHCVKALKRAKIKVIIEKSPDYQ
jgi:hypothetical protein